MSAPIHSLLADELDISEEKAKKLLDAMLREVRKRARSGGVRIPEFGTFREKNGQITFEPSDSLARAVNHRFEGLASEDLASAVEEEDEEQDESDSGPSTITLGYQASDWTPLDSPESDSSEPASSEDEASDSDTEEFHVPSTEETADSTERQTTGTPNASSTPPSSEQSPSAPDTDQTSDTSGPDTEDLYPLVEDVPGKPSESSAKDTSSDPEESSSTEEDKLTEEDEERESLGRIWNSDVPLHERTQAASSADEETSSPPSDFSQHTPSSSTETPSIDETSESVRTPSKRESVSQTHDRSSIPRILTTVLVILLLGGGAWYILGEKEVVPPLQSSLAHVSQQIQGQLGMTTPSADVTSSDESASSSATSETEPATSASTSSEDGANGASPSQSAESSASQQSSSAPGVDVTDGGWTIVVGSRTERSPAEALQATFQNQFSDRNLPVDILEGQSGNTTRYRVAVGEFESREEAQQFLSQYQDELPEGAWPLSLQ